MILSYGSHSYFFYTEVKRIEIWGGGQKEKGAAVLSSLNAVKEMYVLALILDASYCIEGEKKVVILYEQNTLLQKFWSYILIPLDMS